MKRILVAIILAIPFLGHGQSNFKKGYVVTNSGDTLKGFIDFKERRDNISEFSFKSDENAGRQTMSVVNCSAYEVDGVEQAVRFVVNISLGSVDVTKISHGIDTTFRRDTVFLKVVQTGGRLTLYSYSDDIKERFYIKDINDQEPTELIRSLYFKDNEYSKISENRRYIYQIYAKMIKFDPHASMDKVKNLNYNWNSLKKIVAGINGVESVSETVRSTRFFAGLGINASRGGYQGDHDLADPAATHKTSYLPMVSGGVDFFVNPAIRRTLIRAEVFLLMNKNEFTVRTNQTFKAFLSHSFDQVGIVISPQLIHNFYNTEKIKVLGGVGAAINLMKTFNNVSVRENSVSGTREVTDDAVELRGFQFTYMLKAGIEFNKKIEVALAYWPTMPISNYNNFNVNMQRVTLGVNYMFGK